jgi:Tol biopolymer transport system component
VAVSLGAPPNLYLRSADGTERRLTNTPSTQTVWDWSRDGRWLLYTEDQNSLDAATRSDLWVVAVDDTAATRQLTRGPSRENQGRFSPDGRWMTYTSDETGRDEINLQRVETGGMRWRVSTAGGSDARWRADGREVFYRSPDGTLMSVNVRLGDSTAELKSPVPLFKIPAGYDTSADGQRFLALASVESPEASPMAIVTGWQADLKAEQTK